MNNVLFKVKIHKNPELHDDGIVEEIMNKLMVDYPEVVGYTYERINPDQINILLWGDIEIGV
jgi:hypothetical protein